MFISTSLMHYKRRQVMKALVAQSEGKEISVMFGPNKFGKRPDMLTYDNDVLEFAKRKASSFHCSEETWSNPLLIKTGMSRKELDELRIGWDLIFDIDCPDWEFSKLIAYLFIKALREHGISAVTAKFSGNKGFHIAVPFESFPTQIPFTNEEGVLLTKNVKNLFPEAPRRVALFLLNYIRDNYSSIKEKGVDFDGYFFTFDYLKNVSSHSSQSYISYQCVDCQEELSSDFQKTRTVYSCSKCGHYSHPKNNPDIIRCEKCSHPVYYEIEKAGCPKCGSKKPAKRKFNLLSVIEVDTVLISSRHLYRMSYSLHEKSGLVSIPINPDFVLDFQKDFAKPENISFETSFLDRSVAVGGEASRLFRDAFDDHFNKTQSSKKKYTSRQEIPIPKDAIPETLFPPCIKRILAGLKDGRKRSMFVLVNFLRVSGWGREQIADRLKIWNKANDELLREQYIKGQLFQIKKGKPPVPPPNCSNTDYYKSLLLCNPDSFCSKIKNPAMYAKLKFEQEKKNSKKKTSKKATKKKSKFQKTKKLNSKKSQNKDIKPEKA